MTEQKKYGAIVKGIPLPPIVERRKYHIEQMEIGDSILTSYKSRANAFTCLKKTKQEHPERAFHIGEFSEAEGGVRIWRIADKQD